LAAEDFCLGIIKTLKERLKEREKWKNFVLMERSLSYDLQRTELQHLKKAMKRRQELHKLQKKIHDKQHQKDYVV